MLLCVLKFNPSLRGFERPLTFYHLTCLSSNKRKSTLPQIPRASIVMPCISMRSIPPPEHKLVDHRYDLDIFRFKVECRHDQSLRLLRLTAQLWEASTILIVLDEQQDEKCWPFTNLGWVLSWTAWFSRRRKSATCQSQNGGRLTRVGKSRKLLEFRASKMSWWKM